MTSGMVSGHRVMEQLTQIASREPGRVLSCFQMIVEGNPSGWRAYNWHENARPLLSAIVGSHDAVAKEQAVALIHRLGARGYTEFRDLLP
jgi:hypothetical protein